MRERVHLLSTVINRLKFEFLYHFFTYPNYRVTKDSKYTYVSSSIRRPKVNESNSLSTHEN